MTTMHKIMLLACACALIVGAAMTGTSLGCLDNPAKAASQCDWTQAANW